MKSIKYNEWLNIDDIVTIPQKEGESANYGLGGAEVILSKEKPKDEDIGFLNMGLVTYTKPSDGSTLWVKFRR